MPWGSLFEVKFYYFCHVYSFLLGYTLSTYLAVFRPSLRSLSLLNGVKVFEARRRVRIDIGEFSSTIGGLIR